MYKMTLADRMALNAMQMQERGIRNTYEERKKQEQKAEKERQNAILRAGASVLDVASNVLEGATRSLEGIYDFAAGTVGLVGGIFDEDFRDRVEDHVKYDFTSDLFGRDGEEGIFDYDRQWLTDASYLKEDGLVNKVAQGVGGMLPSVAITALTGGAGAGIAAAGKVASSAAFMGGAAGQTFQEALNKGADYNRAWGYGAVSGLIEGATEQIGGVAMGGSTELAESVLGKYLISKGKDALFRKGVGKLAYTFVSEGAEEILSDLLDPVNKKIFGIDETDPTDWGEVFRGLPETFVVGGLTGVVMEGLQSGAQNLRNKNKGGKTYNRIAEDMQIMEDVTRASEAVKQSTTKTQAAVDKMEIYAAKRVKETAESISQNAQALTKEQRTSLFEEAPILENYLDADGKLKADFTEQIDAQIATGRASNTSDTIFNAKKEQETLARISEKNGTDFTLDTDPITEAEREAMAKLLANTKALGEKGSAKRVVLVKSASDNIKGFQNGNTIYMTRENLNNGKWSEKLMHETGHIVEETSEYTAIAETLAEDKTALASAIATVADAYADGDRDAVTDAWNKVVEKKDLTEKERVYLSEIMARMVEKSLGSKESVRRIARSDKVKARRILNWLKDTVGSIGSTQEQKRLRKLEKMFEQALYAQPVVDAYHDANKKAYLDLRKEYLSLDEDQREEWLKEHHMTEEDFAPDKLKTEYADDNAVSFSIQDGKVVVDTDQEIFDGVDREDYGRVVRNYMRQHFRGKEVGDTAFVRTSEREYTHSHDTQRQYNRQDGIYEAKMRASTELDNMLRACEYIGHEDAEHPHNYNGKGYDRYSVTFDIGGENFTGKLLVAIGNDGRRLFYDIVNIKRTDSSLSEELVRKSDDIPEQRTTGSEESEAEMANSHDGDATSTDSISQTSDLSTPESTDDTHFSKEGKASTDKEYIELAKNPNENQERLSEMVERAAANAGYRIHAYHGTPNGNFTVFDKGRVGKGNDQYGAGFYFSSSKSDARHYGNRVIDSYLRLEHPINIGDASNIYEYDKSFTKKQAYEIIKRHPMMFDEAASPLGDFYEEYWEKGAEDWMIRDLAEKYNTLGYLEGDLFRDYPNEFHEAVREVTGYDGIEVSVEGGKFYVAWFDNQMKSAEPVTYDGNRNVVPLSKRFNPGKSDIRYSKDTGRTYTEGEVQKIIANLSHEKVYTRTDASAITDKIIRENIAEVMAEDAMGDEVYALRGKSREEVINKLWVELNRAQPGKRAGMANAIAEYIINHTVIEESDSIRSMEIERHAAVLEALRPYLRKLNLDAIRGEIKARYDKDARGIFSRWSARKGEEGYSADKVAKNIGWLAEDAGTDYSASDGIFIDTPVEAEIFFRLNDLYEGAKAGLKKQAAIELGTVLDEDQRKTLQSRMVSTILAGFDGGHDSFFKKTADAYRDTVAALKKDLKEARTYNTAVNRLLDKVQKIKDWKTGNFVNASTLQPEALKKALGKLGNIKYRGDINQASTRSILGEVALWYSGIEKTLGKGRYDQHIADTMAGIAKGEGRLTLEELRDMSDVFDYFKKFTEDFGKVYRAGKYVDAKPIVKKHIETIEKNKSIRVGLLLQTTISKYAEMFNDPASIVRRMDLYENGFFTETFDELRKGAVKSGVLEMRTRSELDTFFEDHKRWRSDTDKATTKYLGVEIPKRIALSLYMSLQRAQAVPGIIYFGFSYYSGKKGENLVQVKNALAYDPGVSTNEMAEAKAKELLASLKSQFSSEDLAYLEIAQRAFEKCREMKKETDLRRNGYTNVESGFYYPIKRANVARSIDVSYMDESLSVNRQSFNKSTVKGAKGELLIEAVDLVVDRHIKGMSLYKGLSSAVDNFDTLFNLDISDTPNNPTTLEKATANVWRDGKAYFQDLIECIGGRKRSNSDRVTGSFDKILGALRGGYAKFQLGANPKVLLTQLSSLIASTSMLDFSCVMQGILMKNTKEEVYKYCPLAELRAYEQSAALAMGVTDKALYGARTKLSAFGDALMKPIGWMDGKVVQMLFNACQLQVQKDSGLAIGTEENKVKAGEMLENVILETQQNALATERSAAMRSGKEILRTLTMFSADSMKNIGRFFDAACECAVLKARLKNCSAEERAGLEKRYAEAKKRLGKATAANVGTAIFMALIAQGFRFLYDRDDEDDVVVLNMSLDAFGNLLGGLPIVKDVYALFAQGYDINNYAYSSINDLMGSFKDTVDESVALISGDKANLPRALRSMTFSLGQVTGIPTRNIYNVVSGLTKRFAPTAYYQAFGATFSTPKTTDISDAWEKNNESLANAATDRVMFSRGFGVSEEQTKILSAMVKAGGSIPSSTPDYVTANGMRTELSRKQKAAFSAIYSEAADAVDDAIKRGKYADLTGDMKSGALSLTYRFYYQKAQAEALGMEGSRLYLIGTAVPIEELAKAAAIASSYSGTARKEKITAYVKRLNLTAVQKYMIMGYFGYKNKNGEVVVKSYIARMDLSKDDKTRLLKYAGY